jgi:Zn-dependent protease with chaperone function
VTWYRPGVAVIALSVVYGISFFVRWRIAKILNAHPQRGIDDDELIEIKDLVKDSDSALLFRVTSKLASKFDGELIFLLEKDDSPNAWATSHGGKNWIAITTGALDFFTEQELDSVLLHELGHIQNRDSAMTRRMLGEIESLRFYWIGLNWIELTIFELLWAWFTSIFDEGGIIALIFTIVGVVIAIPIIILITVFQIPIAVAWVASIWFTKWFSWNRELLADDRVKSTANEARHLATAFARMENELYSKAPSVFKRIEMWAEQGSDEGWRRKRESPFEKLGYNTDTVGFTGVFASLFSTHPSPKTRIRRVLDIDRRAADEFISRSR